MTFYKIKKKNPTNMNELKDAVHPYIYFDVERNVEFETIKQLVAEDSAQNGGKNLSDSTIIALQGFQNNIHNNAKGAFIRL